MLLGTLATPALAQQTAVGFTANATYLEDTASIDFANPDTGAYDEQASYNLGWQFTVNSSVLVTKLGFFADPAYYDPSNPSYSVSGSTSQPFAQSHAVGVYKIVPGVAETGLLLFSATVTQSDPLVNSFRYAAPTLPIGGGSFVLAPGQYVIAGVTGADDPFAELVQQPDGSNALVTPSAITFFENRVVPGSTLAAYPTMTEALTGAGYFGPNFQFQAVPETSSVVSLGLLQAFGTGCLYAAKLKRRS